MRILHCISNLTGGGAERQFGYLACQLAQNGHEVHVAYLAGRPVADGLEQAGVHLHPLPHRTAYDPLLVCRIVRLIWRVRPDLVHTWILQMDVVAGIAARVTRTPWLLREPASAMFWAFSPKTWLRRQVARTADAVVSNSSGGDAYWRDRIGAERRYIIDNAIPIDAITHALPLSLQELGLKAPAPVVVFAGRLNAEKNVEVLVSALIRVASETPACAVLFGEGTLRPTLERMIAEAGLQDRILMPGHSAAVWSAMKAADLLVLISPSEGRPNVVLEAMACQCPLVVSDIPGHRELLDDDCALFVKEFRDPSAVAGAIRSVLADPVRARQRSEAAAKRVQTAGIDRVAEAYVRVYETITRQRASF